MTAVLKKNLTTEQKSFLGLLQSKYGPVVTRKNIIEAAKEGGLDFPWWLLRQPFKSFRTNRGHYNLESILVADTNVSTPSTPAPVSAEPVVDTTTS